MTTLFVKGMMLEEKTQNIYKYSTFSVLSILTDGSL